MCDCVCACVHVCVSVCDCLCACIHVCVSVCACDCVCVTVRMCVCGGGSCVCTSMSLHTLFSVICIPMHYIHVPCY